jgi:hypothetical protein
MLNKGAHILLRIQSFLCFNKVKMYGYSVVLYFYRLLSQISCWNKISSLLAVNDKFPCHPCSVRFRQNLLKLACASRNAQCNVLCRFMAWFNLVPRAMPVRGLGWHWLWGNWQPELLNLGVLVLCRHARLINVKPITAQEKFIFPRANAILARAQALLWVRVGHDP